MIHVVNQSTQSVAENSVISLGSVQHRCGCNARLSGNALEIDGQGYYKIDAVVSAAPTAEGEVSVALYDNGVQVPGAIAYAQSGAAEYVTLPIIATIRKTCCSNTSTLTLVLLAGAGTVKNVAVRVS